MQNVPPPCPASFVDLSRPPQWEDYWKTSKNGHAPLPNAKLVGNWCKDVHPWQEEKHGYFLGKEGLFYRHPNGRVYPASGVDSFPPI